MSTNKAVLLLAFNRLDYIQKVLPHIAEAKPPRFYIACDGPRPSKDGEADKVNEVRNWILANITWDCEIKTRFLETNSGGCGAGISGAVNWFFETEEDGIIIEDDCVPNESFFNFCEELLDKYKNEKSVWTISGYNGLGQFDMEESYYFGKIPHSWGWATWVDRWKYFSLDLSKFGSRDLENFSPNSRVKLFWKRILKRMNSGEIDSWLYPWTYITVKNKGLCIFPQKNLISNIGNVGVHYAVDSSAQLNTETYDLKITKHPDKVEFNQHLIDEVYKKFYHIEFEKEKIGFIQNLFSIKSDETHNIVYLFGLRLAAAKTTSKNYPFISKKKIQKEFNNFSGSGVTSEKRTPKLTVIITSSSKKIYDLHFTIFSLLQQKLKPDEIVIWLDENEFAHKQNGLPETILNFQKNGLKIEWYNSSKNTSITDLALQKFSEDIIVRAEENIYYRKNWLSKLYKEHLKDKKSVIAYPAQEHPTAVISEGGILYPPNSFNSKEDIKFLKGKQDYIIYTNQERIIDDRPSAQKQSEMVSR